MASPRRHVGAREAPRRGRRPRDRDARGRGGRDLVRPPQPEARRHTGRRRDLPLDAFGLPASAVPDDVLTRTWNADSSWSNRRWPARGCRRRRSTPRPVATGRLGVVAALDRRSQRSSRPRSPPSSRRHLGRRGDGGGSRRTANAGSVRRSRGRRRCAGDLALAELRRLDLHADRLRRGDGDGHPAAGHAGAADHDRDTRDGTLSRR